MSRPVLALVVVLACVVCGLLYRIGLRTSEAVAPAIAGAPVVSDRPRALHAGDEDARSSLADPEPASPEDAVEESDARVSRLQRSEEYGTYRTLAEVRESAVSGCLGFLPSRREYLEQVQGWKVGDRWVQGIPFSVLKAEGFELDAEALEAAQAIRDGYAEALRLAGEAAYDQFQRSAEEYARTRMQKLPANESAPRRPPRVDEQTGEQVQPGYSCYTSFRAGKWRFVVDFRSYDFPELEEKLSEIERLKARRERDIALVLR